MLSGIPNHFQTTSNPGCRMTLHTRGELMEDCNLWKIEEIWHIGRENGRPKFQGCPAQPATFRHLRAHSRAQKHCWRNAYGTQNLWIADRKDHRIAPEAARKSPLASHGAARKLGTSRLPRGGQFAIYREGKTGGEEKAARTAIPDCEFRQRRHARRRRAGQEACGTRHDGGLRLGRFTAIRAAAGFRAWRLFQSEEIRGSSSRFEDIGE